MRVIVTSGTGFIGGHVAAGLIARGHDVLVLDDCTADARHDLVRGASRAVIDPRDGTKLTRVMSEFAPDAVCHQALHTSLAASLALLEASVRSGARSIVLASKAVPIYGEIIESARAGEERPERRHSPDARAALAVEDYLAHCERVHGVRGAVLRLANVYGPRQENSRDPGVVAIFLERMLRGEPIVINARTRRGDDGCLRDYVFVGDVVRAHLAALEDRVAHRIVNVCTGTSTSTRELAERIRRLCGSHSSVCHASPRSGDLRCSVLDPARCRELYEPTSLSAGLTSTLPWFAARVAVRASLRAVSNSAYFMPSTAGE